MRTTDFHLQRSTETEGLRHSCLRQRPPNSAKARHTTKHNTLKGITGKDLLSANRSQPGMWHSRPGCDFAPQGASKSAPQVGTPADLALDTHPAYELIDRITRQLHGVLHGIQADGEVTEEEVYGLRDWLEHFRIFRGAWPLSDAFALDNTQPKFGEIGQADDFVLSLATALGRVSMLESLALRAFRGDL